MLHELLADRSGQQQRLAAIESLIRQKTAEQDQRIATRSDADIPGLLKWGTEMEKLNGQIHYVIDTDIVAEERDRLGTAVEQSRHIAPRAFFINALSGLL